MVAIAQSTHLEHSDFPQRNLADLRVILRLQELFDGDDAARFLWAEVRMLL